VTGNAHNIKEDINHQLIGEGGEMAGNKISINDSEHLSWFLKDEKMNVLVEYLNKNGTKINAHKSKAEGKMVLDEKIQSPMVKKMEEDRLKAEAKTKTEDKVCE